jgi:uncharacterized membrane protein
MAQANVISSAGNVIWYTDRAEIAALSAGVTYQVYAPALGSAATVGNIYSNAVAIPNGVIKEIYVGAGNYITITGTFTAAEIGTASSAQEGVIGSGA